MKLSYLALLSMLYFTCSCSPINRFFGLSDDNFAEESVEDVIKGRSGLDVDLTPGSPEKK